MKVANSIKTLKKRHKDCRVIRRKGRIFVINKTNLTNAIPLCGKHHRQLTDHRLTHTIHRDHHDKATITYTWRKPGDPWNNSDPPTPDTHT